MLVEIKSLSADPTRGCYKSNKAFAKFFNLSASRVSEIISGLQKKGYLKITQKRDGKRIVERNIFVIRGYSESRRGYSENAANPIRNPEGGYSENAEESSTGKRNTLGEIQGGKRGRAIGKPERSESLDFSPWPTAPSPEVLSDWKRVRRSALTQAAIDLAASDLHKAYRHGFAVDYCLKVCCLRGWRGFKFEWLENHEHKGGQIPITELAPDNQSTREKPAADMFTDISWSENLTHGEFTIEKSQEPVA